MSKDRPLYSKIAHIIEQVTDNDKKLARDSTIIGEIIEHQIQPLRIV